MEWSGCTCGGVGSKRDRLLSESEESMQLGRKIGAGAEDRWRVGTVRSGSDSAVCVKRL